MHFQPGEAINEKVLARKYKGSRTPLRESVMRLQQESLLRLVPNKGYFVSHLTIHELNEMYEYRAELEGFTAELAARRWSDQSLLDRLAALAHIQHSQRRPRQL
jgi:GntR family transcriptional regulator, rspAB operon transcriptional repressor